MIQELIDLKQSIIEGRTDDALEIIDDLNQMGRKSLIRNIKSYLVRLLIHLIKNEVEQRLTNSWAVSIAFPRLMRYIFYFGNGLLGNG